MRSDSHKIEDRVLLWKACHEGCGQSLSAIYIKYKNPVCNYLRKAGADGFSEDICQKMFLQIHTGHCNYNGRSDVKSYLFGIAGNTLNQELKPAYKISYGSNHKATDSNPQIPTTESPIKTLQRSELHQILHKEIDKLPPKSRQAIQLVYIDDIPAKKATKIANCDFKTFRDRLNYGLKCLKKCKQLDEM